MDSALAELSTRQIAGMMEAKGMQENEVASKQGGGIAKTARIALENKTGKKVITRENYLSQNMDKMIKDKKTK